MIKLALVGTAHIHTPSFANRLAERSDVEITAVWDHDPARAKKYSEKLKAPAVAKLDDIWQDASTGVIICSETKWHEDLALPAVAAKKHVFIEKPLGMGRSDAYAIARAIRRAGVIFEMGFFRRGFKSTRTLKSLIEKKVFGEITRARDVNMHHGLFGGWFDTDFRWMADPKESGVGAFGDMGAHAFDLLIWLLGDVERVTALLNPVTRKYGECDETGEALLKFKSGANATVGAGWIDHGNPVATQISGTEAIAYIQDDRLHLNCKGVTGKDGFQPYTEFDTDLDSPLDMFIDAVGGQRGLPLIPVEDAAYGSAVMDAIYQAAHNRTWVTVGAPEL